MDNYEKWRKADLIYYLREKEKQVEDLQLKLIIARNCAECFYCENRKCKNHQYHMLEME
jgi:hypothetical protein